MKTLRESADDFALMDGKRPVVTPMKAAITAALAALSLGLVTPMVLLYQLVRFLISLANKKETSTPTPPPVEDKDEFPPIIPPKVKCPPLSEREFDVVVLGATGFAGRLATEYLAKQYGVGGQVKWAIAARRVDAAQKILDDVAKKLNKPEVSGVACIKADTSDEDSLHALCARTRVVATTVGPFQLYGTPVVRAAISCGTSYVDITGEGRWVSGLTEHYDAEARKAGSRIVNCTGHDCVPFDLTVMMCAAKLPEGEALAKIRMFDEVEGKPSGGTLATMTEEMKYVINSLKKGSKKKKANPLYLLPDGSMSEYRVKNKNVLFPGMTPMGAISAFVMAEINIKIVARSNVLNKYGPNIEYCEGRIGPSVPATVTQLSTLGVIAPFFLAPDPIKYSILPKPGDGPTEAEMDRGYLQVTTIGTGERGTKVGARLYFPTDPGYRDTARMIVESALCMALTPERMKVGGGVLTPASCMGDVLLERLLETGCKACYLGKEEAARLA